MRTSRLVAYQVWSEQRSFWRNPEYAFFTFALPIAILVAIGATKSWSPIPGTNLSSVALFVPGILAFGVVVAAYGNLAARIAILRGDGVLKRIRTTPLRPTIYLAGELTSTLTTTLLVAVVTILLGDIIFGAAPLPGRVPLLCLGLCVGIVCFAALALAVSTAIRSPDVAGPITNATYLPVAIISGLFDPALSLPAWLSRIVGWLPVRPLAVALDAAYDPAMHQFPGTDLLILAAWTAVGVIIALRYFRWQVT
jgi:ABC-2 type transport system permease protein